MNRESKSDRLPLILFILTLLAGSCLYGIFAQRMGLFPAGLINSLISQWRNVESSLSVYDTWVYIPRDNKTTVPIRVDDKIQPGLTKIISYGKDGVLSAQVVNQQGQTVHTWNVDWFDIWPDATHLTENELPKSRPGTTVHGAVVTSDGGLIFNYEEMGLVRIDACSNIVWRLPRRTHHSIYVDEEGFLWVPDVIYYHDQTSLAEKWPGHRAPFKEFLVLKVSPDGKVVKEYSMMDIFEKNQLHGLLYLSSTAKMRVRVTDDTLHLNDVEVFPKSIESGVFRSGDIMVSLRNINGYVVFDPQTEVIKYLSVGKYVRQHDPDFIDGNHVSVFDNNNLQNLKPEPLSKVVIESAVDGSTETYYDGEAGNRFFTNVQGKHQWLENGNLLLSVSAEARAIEVSPDKEVVWEYYNVVSDEYLGAITEAERLPSVYTKSFFANASAQCQSP